MNIEKKRSVMEINPIRTSNIMRFNTNIQTYFDLFYILY